jgi:SAM-dependent methyltransferase
VEPTERNRRAWDEIHRRRARAMRGRLGLPEVVREALGDLTGRRVLNLQCATGESAAELAELGGLVTGVDISSEALAVARERWADIAWVEADVHDLPSELKRGRFDLVYSAEGVLAWLLDLDAWAAGIAAALRSGGDLLLYEEHPVSQCVDASLRWREDYFDNDPHVYRGWSHFELTGPPATEEKVERFWRLGQVVSALARAGLVLRQLEEYPGTSSWRRHSARLPGTYIVSARKP